MSPTSRMFHLSFEKSGYFRKDKLQGVAMEGRLKWRWGAFALEKVNEQNRCEPSPLRRRAGFPGQRRGGEEVSEDAEEIGRLSEDAGKTEKREREEEAEDKERRKAGWLQGLTAWMVRAGHKFSQTMPPAGPWGGGLAGLSGGTSHTGVVFLRNPAL